jgi:hypothetical protein
MWAGDVRLTAPPGGGIQPSTGTAQAFQFGNRPPATSDFSVNGVFYQGTTTQDPNNAGIPSTVNLSSSVFDDGVGYGLSTGYGSALLQNATDRSIVPGYRSQMVAFVHLGIGLSQFIPSISYEVTSLGTGTAADLGQSLPLDACPAAVILDLLTSPWGKLALPIAKIDLPSFQAASLTLFNEGHGYSRSIEQTDDAWTIITDVLRQIDAVLYPEPTTGRFVLKLIRNDYDITKALDVNPSNMQPPKSGWYVVSSYSETLNQVRVTWTDRTANYANNIAIGQDPANVVGQGQKLRALDLHFVGCTNRTLATQLASRELTVVSQPLAKATVVVNRTFYAKRLGDVVTLTWPELGISKMVMRIARIDFGQLHGGSITMDLLRDVFDQTLGAYPVPTTAS